MIIAIFFSLVLFLGTVGFTLMLRSIKLDLPTLSTKEEPRPNLSALFPQGEQQEEETADTIQLVATAVGSPSLALIQVNNTPMVVRMGSQVGKYRVVHIGKNVIELSSGKSSLQVSFSVGSTQGLELPTQASVGKVRRSEVERITADPGIMFRQIRLVPYVEGGRTVGFIFEWIDPNSLFSQIGLLQGDILLSINGMEIKSGEDAFRILQTVRNESSLRIDILRNGQKQSLQVRVE